MSGTPESSIDASICQPRQAAIAPLSAWKIHERIAKASEIRMPIAPGSHITEKIITNRTGPATTNPNNATGSVSGLLLISVSAKRQEPNTITHDPTMTAAR